MRLRAWFVRSWWLAVLAGCPSDCPDPSLPPETGTPVGAADQLIVYPDEIWINKAAVSGTTFTLHAFLLKGVDQVFPVMGLTWTVPAGVSASVDEGRTIIKLSGPTGPELALTAAAGGKSRSVVLHLVPDPSPEADRVKTVHQPDATPTVVLASGGDALSKCRETVMAVLGTVTLGDGDWRTTTGCEQEAVVFGAGRAAEVQTMNWQLPTAGPDVVDASGTLDQRKLPVILHLLTTTVGTEASTRWPGFALKDVAGALVEEANLILDRNLVGIHLEAETVEEPARTVSDCTMVPKPGDPDGPVPGKMNVYFVDNELGGSRGIFCRTLLPVGAIILPTNGHSPVTLAHEMTHALAIDHPNETTYNGIDGINAANVMWIPYYGMEEPRGKLSIGQVFRMNLLTQSWINQPGVSPGSPRSCPSGTTCPVCGRDVSQTAAPTAEGSETCER